MQPLFGARVRSTHREAKMRFFSSFFPEARTESSRETRECSPSPFSSSRDGRRAVSEIKKVAEAVHYRADYLRRLSTRAFFIA